MFKEGDAFAVSYLTIVQYRMVMAFYDLLNYPIMVTNWKKDDQGLEYPSGFIVNPLIKDFAKEHFDIDWSEIDDAVHYTMIERYREFKQKLTNSKQKIKWRYGLVDEE
jgi:hypothetical protein